MSSSDSEPYEVFAVLPDPLKPDSNVYVTMWRNYLGEIKTLAVDALDELDAYKQATAYIEQRRSNGRKTKCRRIKRSGNSAR